MVESKELTNKDRDELEEHRAKLPFKINDGLAVRLWLMRKNVMYGSRKRDGIFIIDGPEGAGKTVLGAQAARFLQPERFKLEKNVSWTPPQFFEQYDASSPFDVSLFDEGVVGFYHLKGMSEDSIKLQLHLNTCRSGQRFIIVIQPRYYEMIKSLALERSRFLLHVYEYGSGGSQSRYNFYTASQKETLYHLIKAKRAGSRKIKANVSKLYMQESRYKLCGFPNYWAVDEVEYERLKSKSLREYSESMSKSGESLMTQVWKARFLHLAKKLNVNLTEASKFLSDSNVPLTRSGISHSKVGLESIEAQLGGRVSL